MTLLDDPPMIPAGGDTPLPADALGAGVAWLSSFDPSGASVPELEHATRVLRGLRSFVEGMGVRVDAALAARVASRHAPGPEPDPAPVSRRRGGGVPRLAPGDGSSAEAARRRAAAAGAALAPSFDAALARGAVSLDHVAALGRVRNGEAVAGAEPELLAAALVRSADEFTRWLRAWDDARDRARGVDLDEQRRQRRRLSFFDAELGNGGARVTLTPLHCAQLRDAVFAMSDELWRHGGDRTSTMGQRLADALVELVARGAGRAAPTSPSSDADGDGGVDGDGDVGADGDGGVAVGATARPPRRRPTMLVVIRHEDLLGDLAAAGHAITHDGVPISATETRRLACNADLLPVVLGGDGIVLDAGQRRRYASDAQWTVLLGRFGGCVVGECPALPHWCEAHHVVEFPKGGRTAVDQMWLACGHHHGRAHAEGWQSEVVGDEVHLWRRDGTPIPTRNVHGPVALPPPRPPSRDAPP